MVNYFSPESLPKYQFLINNCSEISNMQNLPPKKVIFKHCLSIMFCQNLDSYQFRMVESLTLLHQYYQFKFKFQFPIYFLLPQEMMSVTDPVFFFSFLFAYPNTSCLSHSLSFIQVCFLFQDYKLSFPDSRIWVEPTRYGSLLETLVWLGW